MTLGELWTMAGYATGALVLWLEARRRGLDTDGMRRVALFGVFVALIGARITQWVLGTPFSLWSLAGFLDPRTSGKSLLGGVVCGYVAIIWAKKQLGIQRSTGDLWALALPAGEAVGRIGCYYNGCCEGTIWHGSWAVFQDGAWRHPAQLYSAVVAALLFGLLLYLRDKMPREGDLFRLFIVLYGATRFAIEFYRDRPLVWQNLSMMQMMCVEIALSTFGFWMWSRWKERQNALALTS